MKSGRPIVTTTKIIGASYLLFFTVIYSSCNQKAPASQPEKPVVTDSPAIESPVQTIGTSATPAAASLGTQVHNVAETIAQYDQMVKEYREFAKAVTDTTVTSSMETLLGKFEQLKKNSDPAMQYFAHHRSEFSKAQEKKIHQDTDEIDKELTIILNAIK